jgi:hypothetical protein
MAKLYNVWIFFFTVMIGSEARAQSAQALFILERSKNLNQVVYEARIKKEGVIDPSDPIHVYWINRVKDPTGKMREELSLIEKNMVYGCKVIKKANGDHINFAIVSYPERTIEVFLQNGKAWAEIVINGQLSRLEKIYISYRETRMFPKVNYIEIFGRSEKNGDVQYEKILLK